MSSQVEPILAAAWAAAQLYVRNRSVALCFEYAPDDIEGGSGVCVEIANRLFIATAAHNFDRFTPNVNWSVFSANRSSNKRLRVLQSNYRIERDADDSDVAWLEIDRESAEASDLVGIQLDGVLLYLRLHPGELYWATGFPVSLSRISQPNGNGHREITIPFGIHGTTVVDQGDANVRSLILDYRNPGMTIDGEVVEVEPRGMSGGGIWYCPTEEPEPKKVWDPGRLKLLALSKAYFRQRHQITTEPMDIWLTVLRNDLPELREIIDPLFQRTTDESVH